MPVIVLAVLPTLSVRPHICILCLVVYIVGLACSTSDTPVRPTISAHLMADTLPALPQVVPDIHTFLSHIVVSAFLGYPVPFPSCLPDPHLHHYCCQFPYRCCLSGPTFNHAIWVVAFPCLPGPLALTCQALTWKTVFGYLLCVVAGLSCQAHAYVTHFEVCVPW